MNFRNVISVSGNMVPYGPKWCPIITSSKKNEFGVIMGLDINVNPYACANLFFNKDDEM